MKSKHKLIGAPHSVRKAFHRGINFLSLMCPARPDHQTSVRGRRTVGNPVDVPRGTGKVRRSTK
jgi:hypothetical protein